MEISNCHSCMMPLTDDTKGSNLKYCKYCTNPDGTLLPKEHVQAGIVQFLTSMESDLPMPTAQKRADYYMKAMPAWADK